MKNNNMPATSLTQLNKNPLLDLGFNENLNRASSENISKAILSNIDNVNFSVDDVVVTVDGVNTNVTDSTAAVTTNVNSNTNTKVETLLQTGVSSVVDFTRGTSYQTLLSYSGEGVLLHARFYSCDGSSPINYGFKVTIDGVVYGAQTGTDQNANKALCIPYKKGSDTGADTQTTPYSVDDAYSASDGTVANIVPIPFKTSLLIEGYSNANISAVRRLRCLYSKSV